FNHLDRPARTPWITERLGEGGPTVAASDYMRAVPDQIARWVPGTWSSLGADGFGFADTRAGARRYFQIGAEAIVVGVLPALGRTRRVDLQIAHRAYSELRVDDPTADADVAQEGADARRRAGPTSPAGRRTATVDWLPCRDGGGARCAHGPI